jgi:hypothetical protein
LHVCPKTGEKCNGNQRNLFFRCTLILGKPETFNTHPGTRESRIPFASIRIIVYSVQYGIQDILQIQERWLVCSRNLREHRKNF